MNRNHVEELLGPYYLGALEPPERRRVEAHLAQCDACRQMAVEYEEAAASLGDAVPRLEAPSYLKEAVLSRIDAEAAGEEDVTSLPGQRGLMDRLPPYAAAAAVAAVFLVSALIGGLWFNHSVNRISAENDNLLTMQHDLTNAYGRLIDTVNQDRWITYIVANMASNPEATLMTLEGPPSASQAGGLFMVDRQQGLALITAFGLEPLPDNQDYQVWFVRNGERTPGSTFTVDEANWGLVRIGPPLPISDFQNVTITVEPAGGSTRPTGRSILWGRSP